ncbi:ATP-binding protein [Haloarculaceae archaeon H-GB11]|nr:ATP-binding protein [Haloarculaceae archaeon H-GB11]
MAATDELHVLLVEDNPGDAKLFRHYVQQATAEGFAGVGTVVHDDSLTDAQASLADRQFDVVFLDLGLPESSGLETLHRMLDHTADTPIVVLTGLDDHEIAVEAIQTGAQDYLVKGDIDGGTLTRSLRYAIERAKHERKLQRQTERMEFFNSILRHDMLNGMSVIRARAEMLDERLDGENGEYAETIVRWSDDIIDLTRKVRRVLDTIAEEYDPELTVEDLSAVVASEAERVSLMDDSVTVETDLQDTVRVRADDLLSEVVGNVLSNAIDHSDGAEHLIRVSVEEGPKWVTLTIADDGPGIDVENADRIFGRGVTDDTTAGSGFGLYFVASMLEAYGGDVNAYNDERGAVFELTFPAA